MQRRCGGLNYPGTPSEGGDTQAPQEPGQEVELPGCQATWRRTGADAKAAKQASLKKPECNGGSNSLRHANPNKPLIRNFAAVFNVQASHPQCPHIQLARHVLRTTARPSKRPHCPRPHATPDLAQQALPNSPNGSLASPHAPKLRAARCTNTASLRTVSPRLLAITENRPERSIRRFARQAVLIASSQTHSSKVSRSARAGKRRLWQVDTIGYIGDKAPAGRECGDTASQGRGEGREREKKNRLWGTLAIASRSPRNDSSGPQAHQQVWMTPMLQLGRVGLLMEVGCNTTVPKRSMGRKPKILQIGWRKIRYRSARPPHRPISRLHNSDPPAPSDVRQLPDLAHQYPRPIVNVVPTAQLRIRQVTRAHTDSGRQNRASSCIRGGDTCPFGHPRCDRPFPLHGGG